MDNINLIKGKNDALSVFLSFPYYLSIVKSLYIYQTIFI